MASFLDTAPFFDQEEWSDITIKFGDREVKCHKMILGSRSEYFKMILKRESGFKEKDQPMIELKDDDPEALEAMLRYIYKFNYHTENSLHGDDWLFSLNVAMVADKYGLEQLEAKAFDEFRNAVYRLVNIHEISKLVRMLPHMDYRPVSTEGGDALAIMEEKIVDKHFKCLIEEPEFRRQLEMDGKLALKYLERVKFAFGLKQRIHGKCTRCWHEGVADNEGEIKCSGSAYCPRTMGSHEYRMMRCWVNST